MAAYWVNVGTFEDYIARPLHWRATLAKKIKEMTRNLREGGTLSGHHRTDRRIG